MADTARNGKVHVMSAMCGQCAFTPQRIVPGSRVAGIVRETKDVEGAHFICHETTIAGTGDAICAGWYDRFSESDPLLVMADRMGVIDRTIEPKGS